MKEQLDFKEKKNVCEQNMKWNMVNTRHVCSLTHTSEMTEICIKQKKKSIYVHIMSHIGSVVLGKKDDSYCFKWRTTYVKICL